MGADTGLMKKMNRKLIRAALKECKTATKPELSHRTGLSVVTVGSLLAELIRDGEVEEAGMAPSGGGRPGLSYRYRNDFRCALILYGHQRNNRNLIHVRVVDLAGKCLWRKDEYYDEITVSCFDAVLDEAVGLFPQTGLLAFGLPGEAVDGVITICDYERISGAEFLSRYSEKYGIFVLFENDINAMTYGCCGPDYEEGSVVGIYFPRLYPPGAGLVLDGKIYYGTGHFAGEIMKLPVPVPWGEVDYSDREQVLKMLKAVLAVFCCVLAPRRLVLYGDFFAEDMESSLKSEGEKLLEGRYQMEIELKENLECDYEAGMVRLALEALTEQTD